jgi:hypothetical protein
MQEVDLSNTIPPAIWGSMTPWDQGVFVQAQRIEEQARRQGWLNSLTGYRLMFQAEAMLNLKRKMVEEGVKYAPQEGSHAIQ